MKGILSAFIFSALLSSCFASKFTTRSGAIYDEHGRYRVFHGTNFVLKEAPWYPVELLNESHVAQLSAWGINAIRLGLMWTGAQPSESAFNQTYLGEIATILQLLSKHEIHAILDCHQDVMSSYFCEYDGFPKWVVEKSLNDTWVNKFPWPLNNEQGCYSRSWSANYLTEQVADSFQDVYSNRHQMRDNLQQYWSKMASVFRSYDFLGYEFVNEPWCGDFYTDPDLLIPGNAGRKNLQPLYDVLHAAMTIHDEKHLFFFEPVTWSVLFNGQVFGTGFTKTPGNDPSNSVLSWHYYCWFFSPSNISIAGCDDAMGPIAFNAMASDARKLNTGIFMTEWGLCDPSLPSGLIECNDVMQLADQYAMSWTNWDWGAGYLQYGWQVVDAWVNAMVRPYVHAYAGMPIYTFFDVKSVVFFTNFTLDPSITEPTLLYVPEIHYGTSYKLDLVGVQATSSQNSIVKLAALSGFTSASITLSPSTFIGE
jgi:endoglycosylceramidase